MIKRYNALTLDKIIYFEEDTLLNYSKRIMDIVLSCLGILVFAPMVILFGILIKLEDGGPVFYVQERLGKNGKEFNLYKLRSMKVDAEKNGAIWAQKEDPRITKVGKWIRRTRIDEIPQCVNILKGEMSIVGPRPERPVLTYEFNKAIPKFIERLKVKPGLTGWAQINGGYDITPEEKLKADMYYINNRRIFLDIYIIFKTIAVVLTGKGAR